MELVGRQSYIVPRAGSTNLQYRRRFPSDLISVLRKDAYARSLGTACRAEAAQRAIAHEVAYIQIVSEARQRIEARSFSLRAIPSFSDEIGMRAAKAA
jgi:hypothetical protein